MEEMTPQETREFVSRSWLGHLGLAQEGRVYVVPLFYAFQGGTLYFQTLPGSKDAYMEGTEEACLTVTRAESEDMWASVMAFGLVEPVVGEERKRAMDALLRVPLPPTGGKSDTGQPRRTAKGISYWKMVPKRLTGRKSTPPLTA